MTDIEQALAEALWAIGLDTFTLAIRDDVTEPGPAANGLATTMMLAEPMQAIARQAAIGYTVECLPQATAKWTIECDPARLFAPDGRLDPDGQPCRFVVDDCLMFEAGDPVQLFERIREHMDADPEAPTDG